MKIGVFSDTHDRLDSLKEVVDIFQKNQVKAIIHCGDWVSSFTLEYFDSINSLQVPVYSVFGNNEGDIQGIIRRNAKLKNPIIFSKKNVYELDFDSRKIVVYHGQDRVILNSFIECQKYDAIFTGHKHQVKNEINGKTLVLNPGSTCYAAESKIIDSASVAIYDTKNNTAEIIYLKVKS